MALSRPLYDFLGFYLQQLYTNPIRTKAVSSCLIAAGGNFTSQLISGSEQINYKSVQIYGLYGLIFGGTIPHYFFNWLARTISPKGRYFLFKQLFVERLLYTPIYLAFSLYVLARMESKSHTGAIRQLLQLYEPILLANWKWLTLVQFLNLKYVPPMLRVLVVNLVGFFWVIFVTQKRRIAAEKAKRAATK